VWAWQEQLCRQPLLVRQQQQKLVMMQTSAAASRRQHSSKCRMHALGARWAMAGALASLAATLEHPQQQQLQKDQQQQWVHQYLSRRTAGSTHQASVGPLQVPAPL
jgi:hypothetical protein